MDPSEVIAVRILCFGDSNVYGYDPRSFLGDRYGPEERWVELLAGKTGWETINAGANGRQIPRGSDALGLLSRYGPVDLFIVMLGTNDLLQGASAEMAAVRMEAFLAPLLPHCRILLAPPPMQRGAWVPTEELVAESLRFVEACGVLAQKLGIGFADLRAWQIPLAFDGVHFTGEGHRIFASRLADALQKTSLTMNDRGTNL